MECADLPELRVVPLGINPIAARGAIHFFSVVIAVAWENTIVCVAHKIEAAAYAGIQPGADDKSSVKSSHCLGTV